MISFRIGPLGPLLVFNINNFSTIYLTMLTSFDM